MFVIQLFKSELPNYYLLLCSVEKKNERRPLLSTVISNRLKDKESCVRNTSGKVIILQMRCNTFISNLTCIQNKN